MIIITKINITEWGPVILSPCSRKSSHSTLFNSWPVPVSSSVCRWDWPVILIILVRIVLSERFTQRTRDSYSGNFGTDFWINFTKRDMDLTPRSWICPDKLERWLVR